MASISCSSDASSYATTQPLLSDMDLDGVLDAAMVMLDPAPSDIFLFPGAHDGDRGLGAFQPPVVLAAPRSLARVTAFDLNNDGAPDYVGSDFFTGSVSSMLNRPSIPFGALAHVVTNERSTGVEPFGDDVAFVVDRGGGFVDEGAVGVRRISGADDVLAGAPATRMLGAGGDLATELRRERILLGPARPLTSAYFASGDVRLVRSSNGRLERMQRFGPRLAPASTTESVAQSKISELSSAVPSRPPAISTRPSENVHVVGPVRAAGFP